MLRKYEIYRSLVMQLLNRIESDSLPIEITVGNTFTDESGNRITNIIVNTDDFNMFNDTMCEIINSMIV